MYASLMVNLELFRDNAALLAVTGDLAERFGAGVVGIVSSQPATTGYGAEGLTADVVDLDLADIAQAVGAIEAQFRAALASRVRQLAWRSSISMSAPAAYVVRQMCGADLLVTGANRSPLIAGDIGRVNTGDVVMQAGRPVLVVPAGTGALAARTVLVAWKDTREARRAVADALPFLKGATRVLVAEIVDGKGFPEAGAGSDGVVAWLRGHGVEASAIAAPTNGDDAGQLEALAAKEGADLVVAGAYGHSRLREWVFGGVTADLLTHAGHCTLMAH